MPADNMAAGPLVVEPIRYESDRTKEGAMPARLLPECVGQYPPGGVGGLRDVSIVVIYEGRR